MPNLRNILASLLFMGATQGIAQLSNGLYAVFHSNFGSMTVLLHEADAPMTVANFVGLTEGSKTWIEETTGLPTTGPYFDGQIVNRIADIPERIVQSGSQNGTNQGGGPGYTFPDELPTTLTHTTGTLSMANSGPNSNGSQFFFCLGDLPELDERHSIFGDLIAGLDVLETIAALPLTNSKPIPDVVWNQVEILRIGTNALAYDASLFGLPFVFDISTDIQRTDTNLIITLNTNQASELHLLSSTNLSDWDSIHSHLHLDNTPADSYITNLPNQSHKFFTTTRVDYEPPLLTPFDIGGGNLIGTDPNEGFQFNSTFTANSSTGTIIFFFPPSTFLPGELTVWDWDPEAYRGELFMLWNVSNLLFEASFLDLVFTNSTEGFFRGTFFISPGNPAFNSSGTFTFTP